MSSTLDYECLSNWNLPGFSFHLASGNLPIFFLFCPPYSSGCEWKRRSKPQKIRRNWAGVFGREQRFGIKFQCFFFPLNSSFTDNDVERKANYTYQRWRGEWKKSVFTRQSGVVRTKRRKTIWLRQMVERLPAMSQSEKVIIRQPWCRTPSPIAQPPMTKTAAPHSHGTMSP